MRSLKTIVTAALVLGMSTAAFADLQSVTMDGSLRIRGNMYEFDSLGDASWVEQRTRLGLQADFTDYVSAYIELDSYDVWGEDFRSNWVTGADGRAASGDDVEMYQAYIQASEMWGTPLQLRVGRQELAFGSQWLLGVNDTAAAHPNLGIGWGLSFDAVRATYAVDTFSLDAFAAKLSESFRDGLEDDVNLYGLYFSYLGLEDHVIDLYWIYVREDNSTLGLPGGPAGGPASAIFPMARARRIFGWTEENNANLNTLGIRGAGMFGAFDYEAEIAYQIGEIQLATGFFGDNELDYSEFAGNIEVGYTFDINCAPRVFLGVAYFGGGDAGDTGGLFRRRGNDLAFNRVFSNWEYSEFIENTDASNLIVFRGGISASPTESLELSLLASYFQVEDEIETGFLWWRSSEDDLGVELGVYADYQYTSDLVFRAGYAHFFGGDALGNNNPGLFGRPHPGSPILLNGLALTGADDDDDYDYLFVETELKF